jgi:DNA-binding transcriptional LysR family regulator
VERISNSEDNGYTPPAAMPDYLIRHTTLRQLQVFEAIVRLGSFTRAAEELFLTQPTVSMQIKKLTDAMGLPLFEHVGRNVRPTEAGLELYEASRRMFEILANLEMKVADLKGMKRGRLRLGVITTAKYLAPEINEDDLYIMGQAPEGQLDVDTFHFAPNPLVLIAPRDHSLVGKKNISLSEISKEPFILREPGSGIREATLRVFSSHGLRPKVRMELGSNEAIKHAVVGGLGLAVLSLHTLTLEGTDGAVAILDVEEFPIMRQLYIVYPKGKELSLVARTFLEFAVTSEPWIRERMESLWPRLKYLLKDSKKPAAPKKKRASKKKHAKK